MFGGPIPLDAALTEPSEHLIAALAARYRLERLLGTGGMASVYLAEDTKHHRKVAVKVLRPELAATLGPDRFLREIEIAAQLQHPHILPLLDSGDADGFLYYVMPWVDGESLRDRLSRKGEFPVAEATRILAEVVDALAYAHGRGVVHRDIKPDNIMLSGRHALVMDFGVAKAVSEATGRNTLTTAGVALGTPAYMAPEQAAADPHVDHRADIYAVGAMAYELLTGRPPFTGHTPQQVLAAHVTQVPEMITRHREAIPPALASTIMTCLAKRPADRWQSADELLAQLEPLVTPSGGTTPTQTTPVSAVVSDADRWYGHPVRVGALFLLTSAAVLGVVYFLTIRLGLPDWVLLGAIALLAAGLPIMIATGLVERRRAQAEAAGRSTISGETSLRGWFTWKRAMLGGVLAFAALGLGTLGFTALRLLGIGPVGTLVASGKLSTRDRLIISDFENRTADSTLGPSVTEAFRIDLTQSPVVQVMPSSAIGEGLARMKRDPHSRLDAATARELALREGARAMVAGEISPVGKGFVLSARLLAPADGAELVALRETADNDGEILKAIDRLSRRMRERIGESLRTIRENPPLEHVTTSSLEALRLYSEGRRAVDLGEFDRGIGMLQQAIALDTGFAMAYRKLAVALGNMQVSFAREADAATKAFEHRDRLPEVERYHTESYYYSSVNYDPAKTEEALRALLRLNPGDNVGLNNLAYTLNGQRRWAEAESLALQAAAEPDHTGSNYVNALIAQFAQGKAEQGRATLAGMTHAFPDAPATAALEGWIAASVGSPDTARAKFRRLGRDFPDLTAQFTSAHGLFLVAQLEGKIDEAERHLRDAMDLSEKRGLPGTYLSLAANLGRMEATFRSSPAAGSKAVDEALAKYPLAGLPALDRPYSELAEFYAEAGQPERGRRMLAEYTAAVPEQTRRGNLSRRLAAGDLALAEGRAQDALTEFRAWANEADCPGCTLFHLGRAYEAANQPDSALAAYLRAATAPRVPRGIESDIWTRALNYKRLGEMFEERGDKKNALEYYGRFVELWKPADPILQPAVSEVKARMARLAGEPRR